MVGMEVITTGNIIDSSGIEHEYKIIHGKDINYNLLLNKSWKTYELDLVQRLLKPSMGNDEIFKLICDLQFHDIKWNWLWKFGHYSNDFIYDWFFILIEDTIQAVSLTMHPKESVFEKDNIFYIEYIAVAPWNRTSTKYQKRYSGLGSIIIKTISKYFSEKFNYRPGFSLSAVPEAIPFYQKIGMTPVPAYDNEGLSFYEFEREKAITFLGGIR